MDDARRLVRHGAPSGSVVVTDYQRAGRGRRAGRSWHSSPGESLLFTVALHRPPDPVTRSLVMAAAVVRILDELGLYAEVKWPNDVLVQGRKMCGILADHENDWLYLGVGINLRQQRFPPELASTATSAAIEAGDASRLPDRDDLLVALLERYRACEPAWHAILSERLWKKGQRVEVVLPYGPTLSGRLAGIAEDGRLLIDAGDIHRLAAGEVSLGR